MPEKGLKWRSQQVMWGGEIITKKMYREERFGKLPTMEEFANYIEEGFLVRVEPNDHRVTSLPGLTILR